MSEDKNLNELLRSVMNIVPSVLRLPETRSILDKIQLSDPKIIADEVGKIIADMPLLMSILRLLPFVLGTVFNVLNSIVTILQRISAKTFDDIVSLVIKNLDFTIINDLLKNVPQLEKNLLKPIIKGVTASLDMSNIGKIVNSTIELILDILPDVSKLLPSLISTIDLKGIITKVLPVITSVITSVLPSIVQMVLQLLSPVAKLIPQIFQPRQSR